MEPEVHKTRVNMPTVFLRASTIMLVKSWDKMEANPRNLTSWLEERFAFQRLDNALLILSSLVNVVFAVGNTAFGREILAFFLPLYVISWVMPIWSGYFLGAVLRKNIVDRMRGWIYLLSGTIAYFVSPITIIWIPLPLGPSQLDPLILPETVFTMFCYNGAIVLFSLIISVKVVKRLFKTVASNDSGLNITLSSKPFLFTYLAIWSLSSMSIFYIWDALRRILDPEVISLELLLYAGIISFLVGLLFEFLATKATKSQDAQSLAPMHTCIAYEFLLQHS